MLRLPRSPPAANPPAPAAPDAGLLAEARQFADDCAHRLAFNNRWDNFLNMLGILLSIAIVVAGLYDKAKISAILGAVVGAIVTAQRAFPFGQRYAFYRTLVSQSQNLITDISNGQISTKDAVVTLKALRLDFAQQLPRGTSARTSDEPPHPDSPPAHLGEPDAAPAH